MRSVLLITLALTLVGLSLSGCGRETAEAACMCEEGKAGTDVWCEPCLVGYIAGEKVSCRACFDNGGATCAACAADDGSTEESDEEACVCSVGTDGGTVWCEACHHGYVDGTMVECRNCFDAGQPCEACTAEAAEGATDEAGR